MTLINELYKSLTRKKLPLIEWLIVIVTKEEKQQKKLFYEY